MPKIDHEAKAAAIRAEMARLREREASAQAARDRLAAAITAAQDAVDLAQVSTVAGELAAAGDALRKLRLEDENEASAARGCAVKLGLLRWELEAAERSAARARVRAILPAPGVGRMTQESAEDFFESLAAFVLPIKAAIEAAPGGDQRGLTEAAALDHLARYIDVQLRQAGVSIADAGHLQAGVGVGPEVTLSNILAVQETLT
jgi:hypothetical protein